MKKNNFFLLSILFLFTTAITAQENVTTKSNDSYKNIIGGSVFMTLDKNDNNFTIYNIPTSTILSSIIVTNREYNSFQIPPYYLRNLSAKLSIGITGTYVYTKSENYGYITSTITLPPTTIEPIIRTISSNNTTAINAWLFARYYFTTDKKFKLFAEPMIGIRTSNSEGISYSVGSQTESFQELNLIDVRVNPGISYSISKRFNFLARLGSISYSRGTENQESRYIETTVDQFPISTNNTTSTSYDVSDFTLNLRLSNIALGAEFLF